ncbi:hypothetical protein Rhopal_003226-T1 [Rhodotorula paludigena]|uniref:DUF155 domain-containing protein n=1 Tax=Rhodotorula paludigena TaxID=86838 RepID=A0AAV5GL76_9BASI|nr:hypothetical protein Rhopal_003226-T1 [Rhodotorula paludigena]
MSVVSFCVTLRAPVQPVQAALPPALQRPQKHKAKKSARGKPAPPASSPSPLLPVGVRAPAAHDRTRPPPDGRVVALTTAESYNTPELLKSLQALGLLDGAVNVLGEAILLPRWSPASSTFFDASEAGEAAGTGAGSEVGQVFIFESGTIVLWGLSMTAAETFLRKVIRGGAAGTGAFVEEGRYPEPETEVLEYWVGQRPTGMSGDSIHLATEPSTPLDSPPADSTAPPSKDLLERLAFSAGMARVTKLGVYEEQFDAFAEGVAGIPKLLESGSESPVKKTDIIKRVGTLHSFRQKLNLEDENLLDEPEFLWEDADLHGHYTAVCEALEFESRLTTLNDRVDYAFSLQTTLMELLNAKTSHRLEWIIILLIAFEISLVLYREGLPFVDRPEPAH